VVRTAFTVISAYTFHAMGFLAMHFRLVAV
jgi:hypothetical protein